MTTGSESTNGMFDLDGAGQSHADDRETAPHKYSDYPGQDHYHIEVPNDLENLRTDQKFVHAGESTMILEIYRHRLDAKRRQTQICRELGIQVDQATTRICRCDRTHWPEQPMELPPGRKEPKSDPNFQISPNGSQETSDAESLANHPNPTPTAPTERRETQAGSDGSQHDPNTPDHIAQSVPHQEAAPEEETQSQEVAPKEPRAPEPTGPQRAPAFNVPRDMVNPNPDSVQWTNDQTRESIRSLTDPPRRVPEDRNPLMDQSYLYIMAMHGNHLEDAVIDGNQEQLNRRLVNMIHILNAWVMSR